MKNDPHGFVRPSIGDEGGRDCERERGSTDECGTRSIAAFMRGEEKRVESGMRGERSQEEKPYLND